MAILQKRQTNGRFAYEGKPKPPKLGRRKRIVAPGTRVAPTDHLRSSGVEGSDEIVSLTPQRRFRAGETVDDYINRTGDRQAALRRLAREHRAGTIGFREAQASRGDRAPAPKAPAGKPADPPKGSPAAPAPDAGAHGSGAKGTVVPLSQSKFGPDEPRVKAFGNWKPSTPEQEEFLDRLEVHAARFGGDGLTVIGNSGGGLDMFSINGRNVQITRRFSSDGTRVDHNFFQLNASSRGSNTKEFLSDTVEAYREMGYKAIDVHANIDVGGYAWLKYGFKPNSNSERDLIQSIEGRVGRSGASGQLKSLVRKLADEKDFAAIADIRTTVVDYYGDEVPLGKMAFKNTNWYGSLDLTSDQGMSRFRAYTAGGK